MGADASDLIESAHDGAAIPHLARRFGLSEAQAAEAVRVMMPLLARGLERNTLTRRGLADLIDAMAGGAHARYADDPAALRDPAVMADGNAILGHILGSPTASRQIAAYGQQETGIPSGILKQMLPYLAAMLMGMLFKAGRGPLGDIMSRLPDILGGGRTVPLPVPGEAPRDGGFEMPTLPDSLPPEDRHERSTKPFPPPEARRGDPSPRPGPLVPGPGDSLPRTPPEAPANAPGTNSLPDLSDILRGGGPGTGVLAGILRSLLGGLTGRGGGGILSWIFKLLILRFGWKLVTGLFRSVLMRR